MEKRWQQGREQEREGEFRESWMNIQKRKSYDFTRIWMQDNYSESFNKNRKVFHFESFKTFKIIVNFLESRLFFYLSTGGL